MFNPLCVKKIGEKWEKGAFKADFTVRKEVSVYLRDTRIIIQC